MLDKSPIRAKRQTSIEVMRQDVFECYIGARSAELHRIIGKMHKLSAFDNLGSSLLLLY